MSNRPVHLLHFSFLCQVLVTAQGKNMAPQSMILFRMAYAMLFKVFSRRTMKKCNALYYTQRLIIIKKPRNTLFQTKTWGTLYLHHEKLTYLFWKFKDSGTTGMQEGKRVSNRDKKLASELIQHFHMC